jgi:hypothetical protein
VDKDISITAPAQAIVATKNDVRDINVFIFIAEVGSLPLWVNSSRDSEGL